MKTYLLNSIQRVKEYSIKLDAQSILYGKKWEVFNDTGEKEVFFFKPNNELVISRNGLVQKGKWDLLSITSILIDIDNKSYLFNAAFVDNKILALQLDGRNEYIILIESETNKQFFLDTINKVEKYLVNEYIKPSPKVDNKNQVTTPKVEIEKDGNKFRMIVFISLIFIFILYVALYIIINGRM